VCGLREAAVVGDSVQLGAQLSFWALIPFALMLLAVAILPLAAGGWFHSNRNKAIVSALLGVPTVAYLIAQFGHIGLVAAGETARDYVSFMVLLFALFTISGGIFLAGDIPATPRTNLMFLASGAVLANVIGTMGASMVLIHPLLRINTERARVKHTIVFFIFLACNIGGLLTPLGPPLFLGYLRGVPFTWTLGLWPQWLLVAGLTLAVYYFLDRYHYRRESLSCRLADAENYVPIRLKGGINVILLVLVVVTVFFSEPLTQAGQSVHFPFIADVILVVLALISLTVGPKKLRAANEFRWGPMVEVAVLFAGIFATMIPALALLQAKGASGGMAQPWQYFWATGGLSAFLDNAPTYLAFASLAQGQVGVATIGGLTSTATLAGFGFTPADLLAAISCGAVFMGAVTYLGNAPNFAVKAIAEHSGRKMPSFLGFMGYSLAVLVPILLIATAVFFL
jgi:Na+/H+ antiporter NhaD/arsenite permease-like protein